MTQVSLYLPHAELELKVLAAVAGAVELGTIGQGAGVVDHDSLRRNEVRLRFAFSFEITSCMFKEGCV